MPDDRTRAECLGPDGSLARVAATFAMLRGRWKLAILFHLHADAALRQSQLLRAMPGLTQKVLTQQLRALADDGLVERIDFHEMPLRVEYRMTERGRRLAPLLAEAKLFAQVAEIAP